MLVIVKQYLMSRLFLGKLEYNTSRFECISFVCILFIHYFNVLSYIPEYYFVCRFTLTLCWV